MKGNRMRSVIERRLLAGTALLAMLPGCGDPEPPAVEAAEDASAMVVPVEFQDPKTRNAIARMVGYWPNTRLTTHENKKVRFYDDLVKGKCVLINFMYTRCDGI